MHQEGHYKYFIRSGDDIKSFQKLVGNKGYIFKQGPTLVDGLKAGLHPGDSVFIVTYGRCNDYEEDFEVRILPELINFFKQECLFR